MFSDYIIKNKSNVNFYIVASLKNSDIKCKITKINVFKKEIRVENTEKRTDLLVWIDLETTGLDCDECMKGVQKHKILEIGVHITDSALNIVDEGLEIIVHQNVDEITKLMVPFVKDMHTKNGLLDRVEASKVTLEQAQMKIVEYLNSFNIEPKSSPICGNNVGFDKNFIDAQMPQVSEFLHYRKIDVSSFKEIVSRQYPEVKKLINKKETHRALDDIKESITELKIYQSHIFVPREQINLRNKLK